MKGGEEIKGEFERPYHSDEREKAYMSVCVCACVCFCLCLCTKVKVEEFNFAICSLMESRN